LIGKQIALKKRKGAPKHTGSIQKGHQNKIKEKKKKKKKKRRRRRRRTPEKPKRQKKSYIKLVKLHVEKQQRAINPHK
jgi:hypothetical protein